jgi:glycosyltransferase involved in cell wall biosynthesis
LYIFFGYFILNNILDWFVIIVWRVGIYLGFVMNVVFLIHSLSSGGAERVTSNLANYWAKKGWNITIVTVAEKSLDFYALHPAVRRVALDLAVESKTPISAVVNNLQRAHALRMVLVKLKPDIALSMMTTANILLALASLGIKHTVCIGSERTYPPMLPLGKFWSGARAILYGRLNAIVALTQESAIWLQTHTSSRYVAVIPNTATWPLPTQDPILTCSEIVNGKKILMAVGRLQEEKGYIQLINIFTNLSNQFSDWMLVILGEGEDRSALESLVNKLRMQERILLPGRAGNLSDWYQRADLYVMTSRFEGFPNTLVEAQAHGLPTISFDCDTGPRDIIRHGVDGLLVPPGNTNDMEHALSTLMGNESLRSQFSEHAIDARVRFSMDKIAGMWEDLFKKV